MTSLGSWGIDIFKKLLYICIMNREEAADILKRFNEWRRDNDSDFPELPDSPALIGEAIDFSVAELGKTCQNCRHCKNRISERELN